MGVDRLGRYGGVGPIGKALERVTLAGHKFDLHFGHNGNMKVYSFVAVGEPIYDFSGDVLDFFKHLAHKYQFPMSEQYMLSKYLTMVAAILQVAGNLLTMMLQSFNLEPRPSLGRMPSSTAHVTKLMSTSNSGGIHHADWSRDGPDDARNCLVQTMCFRQSFNAYVR